MPPNFREHSKLFLLSRFTKNKNRRRNGFPLLLDPQGAVVFPDDSVALVDRDEAVARVEGEHGEAHAEVGREDLVAAEALDFVVVGAGVGEALHGCLG